MRTPYEFFKTETLVCDMISEAQWDSNVEQWEIQTDCEDMDDGELSYNEILEFRHPIIEDCTLYIRVMLGAEIDFTYGDRDSEDSQEVYNRTQQCEVVDFILYGNDNVPFSCKERDEIAKREKGDVVVKDTEDTKKELRENIKELQSGLEDWNREKEWPEMKKKLSSAKNKLKKIIGEIEPGKSYSVEDFADSLPQIKAGSDAPQKKFEMDEPFSEEEKEILGSAIGDKQSIYNFFNKNYSPSNIMREELEQQVEDVKSNNIYDKMAARTMTKYKVSFDVKVSYNKEPITVSREYWKNTTLSMRDINSFM